MNPLLRVELDKYFPIVNANGAKHNLEQHSFEQSQRQYREWQQAQVARKHMMMEENASSSTSSSGSDTNGAGAGPAAMNQSWWSEIAATKTKPDAAQQKKDRVKLSAFEKEQIQNAKRIAKENSLLKTTGRSGAENEGKEDLLDSLPTNTKSTKKRTPAATTAAAANPKTTTTTKANSKGSTKTSAQINNGNSKNNSKDKSQKQTTKNVPKTTSKRPSVAKSSLPEGKAFLSQQTPRTQAFVAPNNLASLGSQQQGVGGHVIMNKWLKWLC